MSDRVVATAPVRVADVGGWTDTWFGSPGRVCHLAVGPGVEVTASLVDRAPRGPVHLVAPDVGLDRFVDPAEPAASHPLLDHAVSAALEGADLPSDRGIEVRIASPALASEPVLAAVERARQRGVPVKVLLGATPQYTVDAHGALSGPNRPFDKGPQGAELARLDAARAQTYIPPRFNEVGSDGLQRGVQAHMAYAVVDVNQAMVCMAPLTQPAPAGLCVQTDARHARARPAADRRLRRRRGGGDAGYRPAAGFRRHVVEEEGHRHGEDRADLLQAAGTDAIRALLIFLDLLEREP